MSAGIGTGQGASVTSTRFLSLPLVVLPLVVLPLVMLEVEPVFKWVYCFPFSYCSSNFAIAKLSLLIPLLHFFISFVDWFMASFLHCFPYSYRSSIAIVVALLCS